MLPHKRKYEMNKLNCLLAVSVTALLPNLVASAEAPPKIPRFSVEYMDKSTDPGADFFHYAAGEWLKNNPVPADKSRWASFTELQERNWFLIHEILESITQGATQANS